MSRPRLAVRQQNTGLVRRRQAEGHLLSSRILASRWAWAWACGFLQQPDWDSSPRSPPGLRPSPCGLRRAPYVCAKVWDPAVVQASPGRQQSLWGGRGLQQATASSSWPPEPAPSGGRVRDRSDTGSRPGNVAPFPHAGGGAEAGAPSGTSGGPFAVTCRTGLPGPSLKSSFSEHPRPLRGGGVLPWGMRKVPAHQGESEQRGGPGLPARAAAGRNPLEAPCPCSSGTADESSHGVHCGSLPSLHASSRDPGFPYFGRGRAVGK